MHRLPKVITHFTNNSIITKCKAFNDEYTVFTAKCNHGEENKYRTIIKFTRYRKVYWSLTANNASDAVINHVALTNMSINRSVIGWNQQILDTFKPVKIVERLHRQGLYSDEKTLKSSYTFKLFNEAGLNATYLWSEFNFRKILIYISAMFGLLTFFAMSLD